MKSLAASLLNAFVFLVALFPSHLEGLFCHRCLALSCSTPSSNVDDALCNSARDYIVKQLRNYYYIGDYLQPCPEPDNVVEWRLMEFANTDRCEEENRGFATCVLGRLEMLVGKNLTGHARRSDSTVIHGTVMGCGRTNLLQDMKAAKLGNNCSYVNTYTDNSRRDSYQYQLEVEHCPHLSDYCTVDYCISAGVSEIRPFKVQTTDSSFEAGTIITIVVIVCIVFLVVIAAAMFTNPLGHATNYSPAAAQEASTVTSVRSINGSIGEESPALEESPPIPPHRNSRT